MKHINLSKLAIWRIKLICGGFFGYVLFFIYTETISYPVFYPPESVEKGVWYSGVVKQKYTYKWSERPYRIVTESGTISWGCRANSKFAMNCPNRDTWDTLIGERVNVVLMPTKKAKYQKNVILSLRHNGNEIVKFRDRVKDLTVNAKNDKEIWPVYMSIIGFFFGVVAVMMYNKHYKMSSHPSL